MSLYIFNKETELQELIQKLFHGCYESSPRASTIINEIVNTIPQRCHEKDISEKLNISQRWLQKECIKTFRITFKKLNRILRVYYAAQLMHKTNLKNSEIAIGLMYTEESSMARDFKKVLGFCPMNVRLRLSLTNPQELFLNFIKF